MDEQLSEQSFIFTRYLKNHYPEADNQKYDQSLLDRYPGIDSRHRA